MDCHSLLQGIFPTQWSNPGLLHFRQISSHLSHQGSQPYVTQTELKHVFHFKILHCDFDTVPLVLVLWPSSLQLLPHLFQRSDLKVSFQNKRDTVFLSLLQISWVWNSPLPPCPVYSSTSRCNYNMAFLFFRTPLFVADYDYPWEMQPRQFNKNVWGIDHVPGSVLPVGDSWTCYQKQTGDIYTYTMVSSLHLRYGLLQASSLGIRQSFKIPYPYHLSIPPTLASIRQFLWWYNRNVTECGPGSP